jgi:hypothetical protein
VEEAERRIREAEANARAGGMVPRSAAKVTVAEREALQRGTTPCPCSLSFVQCCCSYRVECGHALSLSLSPSLSLSLSLSLTHSLT